MIHKIIITLVTLPLIVILYMVVYMLYIEMKEDIKEIKNK
jgi:hypothetical protein